MGKREKFFPTFLCFHKTVYKNQDLSPTFLYGSSLEKNCKNKKPTFFHKFETLQNDYNLLIIIFGMTALYEP
jgi:hypothetical protein